jgi:endoribonuclease Dicer
MPRKKLAKMSAALKMCKLLDEAGELDDNLIPISREEWSKQHLEYDIAKEDEEHKKAGFNHKIGTAKTKKDYEKTVGFSN